MGKKPPAKAGETGSIPGPGRLNLSSRSWELQLLKPVYPGARALQQEEPPQ